MFRLGQLESKMVSVLQGLKMYFINIPKKIFAYWSLYKQYFCNNRKRLEIVSFAMFTQLNVERHQFMLINHARPTLLVRLSSVAIDFRGEIFRSLSKMPC